MGYCYDNFNYHINCNMSMDERQSAAAQIIKYPFLYKICEGCDSILINSTNICPNCKSYRFDNDYIRIAEHAKELGSREQRSVTEDDLF